MKFTAAALIILALACHQAPKRAAAKPPVKHSEMRTIDQVDPRPVILDPPPVLRDEAPPPKPKGETPQPIALTTEDERFRASLPFAPAIAMDPIDGNKVSILAHTPTLEYKGHIYYFSSEANKRTFAANPDQYVKGAFAHL
jgi:YHS domain-containing protein